MQAMEKRESGKRPGVRLGLAAVALASVLALGLSTPASSMSGPIGGSELRSLTPAQKKAKAKALAKCKKIKSSNKRKQCIKRVAKKYGPKPGKTWQVGVWDNYYSPELLAIKANDLVNWTWREPNGREAHDVTLMSGPRGVSPYDFLSPTTAVFGTKFKRQLKVPGTYEFICSLHYQMRMQVKVTR